MKLWYDKAAVKWTQALPLGNGHMGAMVYGGEDGMFDLSEATCWSGSTQDKYLEDDAALYMHKARNEFIKGNIDEGEKLLCHCNGLKENYGTNLPMARLWFSVLKKADKIKRSLELRTGICTDELIYGEMTIKRESFISNPDKVMAVKLSAEGKIMPEVNIRIEGIDNTLSTKFKDNELTASGKAFESMHSDSRHGVSFICHLSIETNGTISYTDNAISVGGAREIILYLTSVTDMFYSDIKNISKKRLQDAKHKGWNNLLNSHISEHTKWMDKCTFELSDEEDLIPTDKRLGKYKIGSNDKYLVQLLFQYGRYLLLGSSRPDSYLPAALQGVWNDNRACRMEWTDDMHLDINTQLNYFPSETTGLSECSTPLFRWVSDILAPQGEKIAHDLYECSGWVAHTVSNAYGWAAPGWGGYSWAFYMTGGAWISCHLWQHYIYSGDIDFLKNAYPILRGAAEFLYNMLLTDPKTGELVVTPSYSPENGFIYEGKVHSISVGATVDTLITKYLFNAVAEANQILGLKDKLADDFELAIKKMPKFRIGKYGQLMEWHEDYEEAYPDHRHTSHLLSLYPFKMIDPETTPDLAQAAKITLKRRFGTNSKDIINANWSGTLLMLYYASLNEGQQALECIDHLVKNLTKDNLMITHKDGIYELDGNTGFTAGIEEMLLHSRKNEIRILPAIPSCWTKGAYQGLVAEGGHKISVRWENSVPCEIAVTAGKSGTIKLCYKDSIIITGIDKNQSLRFTYKNGELVKL